jgi:phosphogluconate dehydratase
VVPLLARLYPNGPADINHFQAAGGVPVLVRELLKGGLLHEDVNTVAGFGLSRYTMEPWLNNGELDWREGATRRWTQVIATFDKPFSRHGGTKVLSGNLGRAVMKTSAVPVENQIIEAPAVVLKASTTCCLPLKRVCSTKIAWWWCVIRGQKRTGCQNYINLCRHLVYYWTAVSKLRW